VKQTFDYKPPPQTRHLIINFPLIPGFPDLISQVLIDQQGLYESFGEHGLKMACLWGQFSLRNSAIYAEIGLVQ